MTPSGPLLSSNSTILWLKVLITVASLVLLYFRYKNRNTYRVSSRADPRQAEVVVCFAVLFSFAVFHNLGQPRSGTFVHYGEMFHYYLGPKYFDELGYFELYNAVIAADAEQDNALADLPFYTDLTTYQNAGREAALEHANVVKAAFSRERWDAF